MRVTVSSRYHPSLAVTLLGLLVITTALGFECSRPSDPRAERALPAPRDKGPLSLEETLKTRRSVRSYRHKALSLEQLSQLLWAANGITGKDSRFRTAPSAGGLHPLDFHVVVGEGSVIGLEAGVWQHEADRHAVTLSTDGDHRGALCEAARGQRHVAAAEIVVVVTLDVAKTTERYGVDGSRYSLVEVGLATENLLLQAHALGLGACVIGGFDPPAVSRCLGLPDDQEPVLLVTMGHPA
jgi:SagB-type dehydrogenase family enzyme